MRIFMREESNFFLIISLIISCFSLILITPFTTFAVDGDLNDSGSPDLEDLIISLQILSGVIPSQDLSSFTTSNNDVDNDGKIGAAEAIRILRRVSTGPSKTVTVTAHGVLGRDLTLLLNGTEEATISDDGWTSFQTTLDSFSEFKVDISQQPTSPNQVCRLDHQEGFVLTEDIDLSLNCSALHYPIGGSVTGLDGVGLSLILEDVSNGRFQRRTIKSNGDFVLGTLGDGAGYEVSILSQPTDKTQTCTLSNGSGIVSGTSINNLSINCSTSEFKVGVEVYGLNTGDTLVIANEAVPFRPPTITINGIDRIEPIISNSFRIADGKRYELVVANQPEGGKECLIANASGTVDGETVNDIKAYCAPSRDNYSVGGIIYNLGLGNQERTITLELKNGIEQLAVTSQATITGNTPFQFNQALPSGSSYTVEIAQQPIGANCVVDSQSSGTLLTNITDVHVSCINYIEPVAILVQDAYVQNGGYLDGSASTGAGLTYTWDTSSSHDFSLIGNGSPDPTSVIIRTDLMEEPLYLDDVSCVNDPLCLEEAMSNGVMLDDAAVNTSIILGVIDNEGHESADNGNTYVYNENYVYVKEGATGTGASPDDATGDIKAAITYARDNGKHRVVIAEGTYIIDIDTGPIAINDGVSLYGGYSAVSWDYDPEQYPTAIKAEGIGVTEGMTLVTPLSTIIAGTQVSHAWIKGLRIYGPATLNSVATTAMWIKGDVTIKDCIITGSDQGGSGWTGVTISNESRAVIRDSVIVADDSGYSGPLGEARVGIGVSIIEAYPTIEANRIRGGGGRGIGVNAYNSNSKIYNNMILGCEEGESTQVCIGVKYVGAARATLGKLYNNTIFGSKSYQNSGADLGGKSFPVHTSGSYATPAIANNILFTKNDLDPSIPYDKRAACIASEGYSPGVLPSSLYSNVCISDTDNTCFHRLVVRKDDNRNAWERAADRVRDAFNDFFDSYNPLNLIEGYVFLITFPINVGIEAYNGADPADYKIKCRNSAESNGDDLIPSGGNIQYGVGGVEGVSFADIDGPDDDFSTIGDNNWNLTSASPLEVIQGGKCMAPDLLHDFDKGDSRTPRWSQANGCNAETGWSIGAFEYDP